MMPFGYAAVRAKKARFVAEERLVAFTDAIIAIAATIMVLELVTPEDTSIHGLLSQWPTFVAYLISFDLIYLVWLNHHNAFRKIDHVTPGVFIWNGIWTFFLPIATLILILIMVVAMTVGMFRMMHTDEK